MEDPSGDSPRISRTGRFRRDGNFVFRKIANEFLLVPIRQQVAETSRIYVLNEVGARIWELFNETRTGREVLETLEEEFDAPRETLEADLADFLGTLQAIPAILQED